MVAGTILDHEGEVAGKAAGARDGQGSSPGEILHSGDVPGREDAPDDRAIQRRRTGRFAQLADERRKVEMSSTPEMEPHEFR